MNKILPRAVDITWPGAYGLLMTNNAITFRSFVVTMVIGNDSVSTCTTVRAMNAAQASLVAEMVWSETTVRVINVLPV